MQSYNSNISVPNFMRNGKGRSSHPRKNSVEQFVTDSYNAENKRINGNFISRNFGSLTAQYGSYSIITIGELVLLATVYAKKKSKFPTPELKNAFRNKMLLMLGGFCVLGI